jgi:hypothetical protein
VSYKLDADPLHRLLSYGEAPTSSIEVTASVSLEKERENGLLSPSMFRCCDA